MWSKPKGSLCLRMHVVKEQVLLKSLSKHVSVLDEEHSSKKMKLTLHNNKITMRRKQCAIAVENKGKSLTLCYNKDKILHPLLPYERLKTVDTLPFGHTDLGVYTMRTYMIDVKIDSESGTVF